jgi:hypothetical protein
MVYPVIVPSTRSEPILELQTARQTLDGNVVTDGPRGFQPNEITPPRNWLAKTSSDERPHAVTRALAPLRSLNPPCNGLTTLVKDYLPLQLGGVADPDIAVWFLVHAKSNDPAAFARALAESAFQDRNAHLIVDCSVAENGHYELFGMPPGCSGCLNGGIITNRLITRPQSVIVLSNFEYVDERVLADIKALEHHGELSLAVARGGSSVRLDARHSIFVLASTYPVLLPGASQAQNRDEVRRAFQAARPEIDEEDYSEFLSKRDILVWS